MVNKDRSWDRGKRGRPGLRQRERRNQDERTDRDSDKAAKPNGQRKGAQTIREAKGSKKTPTSLY